MATEIITKEDPREFKVDCILKSEILYRFPQQLSALITPILKLLIFLECMEASRYICFTILSSGLLK